MDTLSPDDRSRVMSRVRDKNTKPEMKVRRLVHGMGYRYRLHQKHLPGSPDMVFASRKSVIFVHGCFWHRHLGCKRAELPKSNVEFWENKLETNRRRDEESQQRLLELGWRVLTLWECELGEMDVVALKIKRFLECENENCVGG